MRNFNFVLILVVLSVSVETEFLEKFIGEHVEIKCGNEENKDKKISLVHNSITVAEKKHPFVYKLQKIDNIDTGVYICRLSDNVTVHLNKVYLTVKPLPGFKDNKMTKKQLWKSNYNIKYNCELNSSRKFSYKWFTDTGFFSDGPYLSELDKNVQLYTKLYCHIYLEGHRIHIQTVDLVVYSTMSKPRIERIYSIPGGFEIKWIPPINPEFIKSSTLECYNEQTYQKFIQTLDKYDEIWTVDILEPHQIWKCYLKITNEFENSEGVFFEHTVEPYPYKINLFPHDKSQLNLSISQFPYQQISNNTVSTFVINVAIDGDRNAGFNLSALNYNYEHDFHKIGNLIDIELNDLHGTVVGRTLVFSNLQAPYPKPVFIEVYKIKDQCVQLRFLPYSGDLYDYSLITLLFYQDSNITHEKREYKFFIGYREENSSIHKFKISNLLPDTVYIIKFQYKFSKTNHFSELSDSISFKTSLMYLPETKNNIMIIKQNIKIKYEYPSLMKALDAACVIYVRTTYNYFRIFCDPSGSYTLKRYELSGSILYASIQFFTNETLMKEMPFSITKVSIKIQRSKDLFGLMGFVFFMVYSLFWLITKILNTNSPLNLMNVYTIPVNPIFSAKNMKIKELSSTHNRQNERIY